MDKRHEKTLREMFGVYDTKHAVCNKVKARIERMESRMTHYYGRFTEMNADTIATLTINVPDDEVFESPKAPKPNVPTLEDRVKELTKGALEIELEKRVITETKNYGIDELRELLVGLIKEEKAKPEKKDENQTE